MSRTIRHCSWWTAYLRLSMTPDQVRVQRVVSDGGVRSWTLVNADGVVRPAERFLAHLVAIERSPNTVRAYAHDLRDFFEFLAVRGLFWDQVQLEDVGKFVAWLKLPMAARSTMVAVLPSVEATLRRSTVNRKLSALASFYEFHQRHGVALGDLLTRWQPSGGRSGSHKPFLAHLGSRDERRRTVSLKADRRIPRALPDAEVDTLLAACDLDRDRLLLTLLRQAGLRVGEALGLRHEDLDARRGEVSVVSRVNANEARAKSWGRQVPIPTRVIRVYSDYLHEEYGALDSDYVFVNLSGDHQGRPMDYPAVDRLVRRLRARTSIRFTPHELRHSYATDLLRRGVPVEVVQKLMGHASITTTADTYSHLGIEDARRALVAAGVLDGEAS
jgi:integrase/recombinase XerD